MKDRSIVVPVLLALPLFAVLTACTQAGAHGSGGTAPGSAAPGDALACGGSFTGRAGGPLTLTGRFPATAARGGTLTGRVDVASASALHGVGPAGPDVFLVKDGRIVTEPLAQDSVGVLVTFSPGRSTSYEASAQLAPCAPGARELEPGTYQVFARLVVSPDDGDPVAAYGGPWALDVT